LLVFGRLERGLPRLRAVSSHGLRLRAECTGRERDAGERESQPFETMHHPHEGSIVTGVRGLDQRLIVMG
jgi:hypothetical protein